MAFLGEESLQHGAHFGDVDSGDLPDDADIHIGVIVSHDVSHSPHPPKGQVGNLASRRFGQMGRGLADDFDAPDDGILFLRIGAKTAGGRPFDLCGYQARGFQNIM